MPTRHEEGPLARQVTSGPRLHFAHASPEGAARAAVGLLHGYADYGGRYRRVVDAWAEQGIATVSIDMRGHGRAEGPRGYCDRFADYYDDVAELVKLLADKAAGLPKVLFGHSFGGLLAPASILEDAGPRVVWKELALSGP